VDSRAIASSGGAQPAASFARFPKYRLFFFPHIFCFIYILVRPILRVSPNIGCFPFYLHLFLEAPKLLLETRVSPNIGILYFFFYLFFRVSKLLLILRVLNHENRLLFILPSHDVLPVTFITVKYKESFESQSTIEPQLSNFQSTNR
jgi:hypothetical protein